ncbi:hypothetical protein D3C72_1860690 [compost metagenome]
MTDNSLVAFFLIRINLNCVVGRVATSVINSSRGAVINVSGVLISCEIWVKNFIFFSCSFSELIRISRSTINFMIKWMARANDMA